MESIEGALNEGLESRKSPESQMAAHQVREIGRAIDRKRERDGDFRKGEKVGGGC